MGMMDVPEVRRLARVQRFDFWVAIAALLGTLVFGVLSGVLIGVGLSIFWLISVATRPHIPVLAREPGTEAFRELSEHPDDEQVPGVVVLRMDGGLFFATSDALEDRVREIIHLTPDLTGIVLDCGGMDFVDSQGSATLDDIITLTDDVGIVLRLARVKPGFRALLERDHVLERLGPDKVHGNILLGAAGPPRRHRGTCGRCPWGVTDARSLTDPRPGSPGRGPDIVPVSRRDAFPRRPPHAPRKSRWSH